MDPNTAHTLPARYYIDPATFRREFEHFFGRMWVCAGRAEEVPEPGAFVLRQLGDESVLIVRDADQNVSAFYNVCRHRGTRLCTERSGRLPSTISCPYHAWTYDLAGCLLGAPGMDACEGFRRQDYPLRPVATAVWDGHLFVNLAETPAPLMEQLGDLPGKFKPWGMEDLRLGRRIVYDVAANWKLVIQNYSECLHCPVIHPALQRLSHYLSGVNEHASPTSTYLGGWMTLRDGVATVSVEGTTSRPCLPNLQPEHHRRVYYYAVLPNLLLSLHPDYMMTHTLWPVATDRTEVVCEWHFHPAAMAEPGFDPSDAVEFWDLTNRQDWHVSELTQLGMKSRGYSPGPYTPREQLLAALDRIVIHAEAQQRNAE